MDLSSEESAVIDEHLVAGHMIIAIRELRRFTGAELTEAKLFANARLERLQTEFPDRFPEESKVPILDTSILSEITPLRESDLAPIHSIIRDIEKTLFGLNYSVTLDVSGVQIPFSALPVAEVMRTLYPNSGPHEATVLPSELDQTIVEVSSRMMYEGDRGSGPQLSPGELKRLETKQLPDYWYELNVLLSLGASATYSYDSDLGLPGDYVFWFYVYLIHNVEAGRCVVITGMASD